MTETIVQSHAAEVAAGERFEFGKNWKRFLETVDERAVQQSIDALRTLLRRDSLSGVRFLDIGSGSGLSSLAAHRLGADVTSFDYDTDSVACTTEIRRRFGQGTDRWRIMQGSVLDREFLAGLGAYDIVYSWGVLHHTGAMWEAIWNAVDRVAPGGTLFIAIYNDQGTWSYRWRKIKRFYCSGPVGKAIVSTTFISYWLTRWFASDLFWLRNPFARYRKKNIGRGMSIWHDFHDWLGGYPFEFSTPEGLIFPIQDRGFRLTNLVTQRGTEGCIELVFEREH